jgi:hypothetical protein
MPHFQSHWFIYSFISLGIYLRRSPTKHGEKNMVTFHADGRPTYIGVRPVCLRGLFTPLLLLTECHAAFGTIPSTLVRPETRKTACGLETINKRIYSTNLTASDVTEDTHCQNVSEDPPPPHQGTPPHTLPYLRTLSTDEGLQLWGYEFSTKSHQLEQSNESKRILVSV